MLCFEWNFQKAAISIIGIILKHAKLSECEGRNGVRFRPDSNLKGWCREVNKSLEIDFIFTSYVGKACL